MKLTDSLGIGSGLYIAQKGKDPYQPERMKGFFELNKQTCNSSLLLNSIVRMCFDLTFSSAHAWSDIP